jgi:hypothetical protein
MHYSDGFFNCNDHEQIDIYTEWHLLNLEAEISKRA